MKPLRLFPWLLLSLLAVSSVHAIQFYLESGTRRCFTDTYFADMPVLGEYLVAAGRGEMAVDLTVYGPKRKVLFNKRNIVHGKFAFVMPDADGNPKVWGSEFHRKKRKEDSKSQGGDAGHRRRLLSTEEKHYDDKHIEHVDDLHDEHLNDWDYDNYEGIDDEEFQEEVRQHQRNKKKRQEDAGRYEDFDDPAGKVEVCFSSTSPRQAGVHRRVMLKLDIGENAKDYTQIAKQKHLSKLERTLLMASDELDELLTDLDSIRTQEKNLAAIIDNSQRMLYRYALFGVFEMILIGGYQVYYSRTYLKKKKVL